MIFFATKNGQVIYIQQKNKQTNTKLETGCGSGHELHIAKFRVEESRPKQTKNRSKETAQESIVIIEAIEGNLNEVVTLDISKAKPTECADELDVRYERRRGKDGSQGLGPQQFKEWS